MINGFIYPTFTQLVKFLKFLNLVEYIKNLVAFTLIKYQPYDDDAENTKARKNIGIDIFQVAKWVFIICLTTIGAKHWIFKYLVIYLISSNLFTYFYYHAWGSNFTQGNDIDTQRRRFINFLLSIAFYILCYAYLYQFHYAHHVNWPDLQIDTVNSIYLSVANAFTLTYGGFSPLTQTARVLFMTELINTFFFFTIIVTNSIPSINERI